eukprot:NODE_603_length_1315_cov_186.996840_g474_i0.p1 GENE.NODE_603_length_1315_cov_186.996840_g474_i0~~NODE_603_length_1315_cov_186.996840_g474_i0.p1  ORF type:complete len:382 (+),score=145.66 NODE_603_length_1315_cov_186.996840_g474_i0:32-1147(+)
MGLQVFTAGTPLRSCVANGDLLYCGGSNGNIFVFSISGAEDSKREDTGAGFQALATLLGHYEAVSCMVVDSSSGSGASLFSGSYDNTIRQWELASGSYECVRILKGHLDAIKCLEIDRRAGWLCSGSRDQTVRCWKLEDGTPAAVLEVGAMVNSLAVMHSRRLLFVGCSPVTQDDAVTGTHTLLGVDLKGLAKAYEHFHAHCQQQYESRRLRLDVNAVRRAKKSGVAHRKALQDHHQRLVADQLAAQPQRPPPEVNEADPEEEPYEPEAPQPDMTFVEEQMALVQAELEEQSRLMKELNQADTQAKLSKYATELLQQPLILRRTEVAKLQPIKLAPQLASVLSVAADDDVIYSATADAVTKQSLHNGVLRL